MKHIQVNFEVHSAVHSGLTARQLSLKLRCLSLIPSGVRRFFFLVGNIHMGLKASKACLAIHDRQTDVWLPLALKKHGDEVKQAQKW